MLLPKYTSPGLRLAIRLGTVAGVCWLFVPCLCALLGENMLH